MGRVRSATIHTFSRRPYGRRYRSKFRSYARAHPWPLLSTKRERLIQGIWDLPDALKNLVTSRRGGVSVPIDAAPPPSIPR